jgi:cytochrome P450
MTQSAAVTYKDTDAFAGTVLIESLDEVTEILRSKQFRMEGWASPTAKSAPLMQGVLISMEGEPHMARRRKLAKLLDDNAVAEYRDRHLKPTLDHCIAELAAMPRAADGAIHTDLVPLAQRSVYRIAAAVVGIDGLEKPEAADRFIEQVLALGAGLTVDWSREDPDVVLKRAFDARNSFVEELYRKSLERREKIVADARAAGRDPTEVTHDILTLMIANRDEAWAGGDNVLLVETCAYLVAATQTTVLGFTNMILRMEDWFAKHPEDRALMDSDPEFLRRAAFESLRMTISTPVRQRTATEDVTLASGRHIKAGQTVSLHFIPANADPKHFGAEGEAFNPHRKVENASPWGLAFGGGAHTCPGRPLVTGSRNPSGTTGVDGTLVSLVRRYYGAGLTLDPAHPPVRDLSTHYALYTSIPVLFTRI